MDHMIIAAWASIFISGFVLGYGLRASISIARKRTRRLRY
jgi:hypothetical protein